MDERHGFVLLCVKTLVSIHINKNIVILYFHLPVVAQGRKLRGVDFSHYNNNTIRNASKIRQQVGNGVS